MHVHTILSPCSQLDLPDLLDTARAKELDGVCVTDHDTMALGLNISEGIQANGVSLIIGMEYTTSEGDFLLFGPFQDIAKGLPAQKLLQTVQEQGGAAIAAHPFRWGRQVHEKLIKDGFCKIAEGINGRNKQKENEQAMAWHTSYGINLVGGSDAHSAAELGRSTTTFKQRISNSTEMVNALKSGQFTMSRGGLGKS